LKIKKEVEGLTLEGESIKNKNETIITGKLKGKVQVECIKCLEPFLKEVDEEVKFKVVKPPYNGFDEEYDIIEQENFNLEEIIKSEIASIKSDYNVCPKCQNVEFNKEF